MSMDNVQICDECEQKFPITQVQITNGSERTVCSGCQTVEDRIT